MLENLSFRLRALFHRSQVEAELDEEPRAHLAAQVEKYVRGGTRRDDARRRAQLEFGGLDQGRSHSVRQRS